MDLPQSNKAGYDAGSAVVHAKELKGRLMLYYGTADNNVHPSNSLQLIRALQQAGKSFEVQVGPDRVRIEPGPWSGGGGAVAGGGECAAGRGCRAG